MDKKSEILNLVQKQEITSINQLENMGYTDLKSIFANDVEAKIILKTLIRTNIRKEKQKTKAIESEEKNTQDELEK